MKKAASFARKNHGIKKLPKRKKNEKKRRKDLKEKERGKKVKNQG